MKPPKEYLKNLKHHTITEKMLSDCIYSINNRALNSRDNEYKYTHSMNLIFSFPHPLFCVDAYTYYTNETR